MTLMDILGCIFAVGFMFIIGIVLFYVVIAVAFVVLSGILICTIITCAIGPIFLAFSAGNILYLFFYLITIPILFFITDPVRRRTYYD